MMRISTILLRIAIVLIGIGALAVMLWEPHIEGRNAHATIFEIYFKDPFLAYAYVASIPFFAALYQAFKLLGFKGRDEVFSRRSVRALRAIKYCAVATVGFVIVGEICLMFGDSYDRPPAVFMGILLTFAFAVIAAAATVFERLVQSALDMKPEDDLTA